MKRQILAASCALALAGCATPTVYEAAGGPAAVGFSEVRIEPDRYRVTFHGGGGAPAVQVSDYVLLRAAQIAVRDGDDWFRVVDRISEREPSRSGGVISVGGGGASFGRGGGVGLGLGASFPLGGGPAITRSIEVVLGKGPLPSGGDAYDARAVINQIGPRAQP
jgi:hypothetical protein